MSVGNYLFHISKVIACVLKKVVRPTGPRGYDDGCSKVSTTDGYICSRLCLLYMG